MFTGRLSLCEPLMCSNCGWTLGVNFTLHFWQRPRARSRTVCLIASVRCSYFFLSYVGPPLGGPKNDTHTLAWGSTYVLRSQYFGASCHRIDVVFKVALVKRVHFFNKRLARLGPRLFGLGRQRGRENVWKVFLYPAVEYQVPPLVYPYCS